MIGIKVIAFIIYSFLIKFSLSVDLILPLSIQDAEKFQVKKHFISETERNEYIFYFISYEGRPNNLITRVVYHGMELINDTTEHDPDFRRFVLFGFWSGRAIMGISKIQSGITTAEKVFGFNRDNIRNFMESSSVEEFIMENPNTTIARTLSSMFYGTQRPNKRKHDELDSVDDQPKLLRGNTDISQEEIQKEVDAIMNVHGSSSTDPAVAGPSGLNNQSNLSLKRKLDQISESESDSE